MQKELSSEIKAIIKTLNEEGKKHLSLEINLNWQKNLLEYSKYINSYKTKIPLEDILVNAFLTEFKRLGYSPKQRIEIVHYLKKHRVLQTAPHISPAGKPRYFFINWLSSLSLSNDDYFPVAMFSGVPFSNKTRPGRLCRKSGDINLIPSAMQDELVYRNKIPIKMIETIGKLEPKIKSLISVAKQGDSYTAWALKSSQKIEGQFLKSKPVFFDFNEVISNYLLLAIRDPKHPISKIFFSQTERINMIKNFKDMVFFYGPTKKGKYEEMENFFLKDGYLESKSRRINLDPKTLSEELKERLCPGLVVGFLIFAFLNHFQCFGSFAQIEYLPLYREKFSTLSFLKKYDVSNAPAGVLVTGGFPFDPDLHPLDISLDEKFSPDQNLLFGEALFAIKDVLLHQNYSMNLVRK